MPSSLNTAARYGMSSGGNGAAPAGNSWPNPPIESLLETCPGGFGGLTSTARVKPMKVPDVVHAVGERLPCRNVDCRRWLGVARSGNPHARPSHGRVRLRTA